MTLAGLFRQRKQNFSWRLTEKEIFDIAQLVFSAITKRISLHSDGKESHLPSFAGLFIQYQQIFASV